MENILYCLDNVADIIIIYGHLDITDIFGTCLKTFYIIVTCQIKLTVLAASIVFAISIVNNCRLLSIVTTHVIFSELHYILST